MFFEIQKTKLKMKGYQEYIKLNMMIVLINKLAKPKLKCQ